MKVGIFTPVRFSVFSSGASSVAINMYDYLRELGAETELINILPSDKNWYDDCSSLANSYVVRSINELKNKSSTSEPIYDIVIDIDGIVSGEVRKGLGKKSGVFIRKPVILTDIESIVYPVSKPPRHIDGVDFCLVYDYVAESDVDYLKLLTDDKPVYRVPLLWRPKVIEAHYAETGFKPWTKPNDGGLQWHPHVMETNMTNTSSCTLPAMILRQVAEKSKFPYREYTIHNMDQLNNSDYFRDNIKKNSEINQTKGNYIGRQRVIDLVAMPKTMLLSHVRFIPVRPIHLDAMWVGLPIVHNSVLVKKFGSGYERLYYRDNDILGAVRAFEVLEKDFAEGHGIFAEGALEGTRKKMEQFMGVDDAHKNAWRVAFNLPVEGQQAVAPEPVVELVVTHPPPAPPAQNNEVSNKTAPKEITVLFTDMWDNFNPEYNFFLLLLENSSKDFATPVRVKGYSPDTLDSKKPDLLIFGPFGESWQQYPDIPKIHFTGENTPEIRGPNVKLNLGYSLLENSDDSYLRLPLWMLEIDWFNADPNKIRNPLPLPVERVIKSFPEDLEKHKENFCAFVVTNPRNPIRNDAFVWLSMYKHVDSAGRLFNNIGEDIFAGLGGGGGELKKFEFLKKYKFCLAYENASAEGYTTEKLMQAKAAGCIPIYWGDPKVGRDFNQDGFLNAQNVKSPEELIELVQKVDEDDELYKKMYNTPLLDEYRVELVRRRLSHLAVRLWQIMGFDDTNISKIPRFIGTKQNSIVTTEKPSQTLVTRFETSDAQNAVQNMVAVTFATKKFLPSLKMFLQVMKQHKQTLPGLDVIVYLGNDVDEPLQSGDGVTFLHVPSQSPVPEFPDFWEAQHFAWKLWVLNEICSNNSYKGRLIFYMDCASLLVRLPLDYISSVLKNSLCFLEDSRQKNDQWFSPEFCSALDVTEQERAEQQLWAGGFAFVADAKAKGFFAQALELGKQRHVIVGPKWAGTLPDGRPFGHRHDQSILTLLASRNKTARYPLDSVYCDYSLRRTFKTGCSLYVHRGQFANHKVTFNRISEMHMINLKRRPDRLKRFYESHPYMNGQVIVDAACDGRAITMTPALSRLFKPNDFLWKKAILGCAMSHLKMWLELANDESNIENYLILEDDVKFEPGWENIWNQASQMIPEDYDVLYLGGILPPNRPGYNQVLEKVNMFWSRVREHNMFGQNPPNRYFHVCNYSYILSKKGAQKILASLVERDGYYTSADHMVCNRIDILNHYFLTPLVTGSYQDDDPKYANSQFNDFNRIDGFDSDLWNNDERFTEAERSIGFNNPGIDFNAAIKDAFHPEVLIGKTDVENTVQKKPEEEPKTNRPFYTLSPHKVSATDMMEATWLTDLLNLDFTKTFGKPGANTVTMEIKSIELEAELLENPIFIVQRPYTDLYIPLFEKYEAAGKPFYVLHLSDEYCQDTISWYRFASCKGVVRTYMREFDDSVKEKVCVIPLGYNRRANEPIFNALKSTPSLPFRELNWSFRGTRWMDREAKLAPLKSLSGDHVCVFYNDWKDPFQATREQYIGELMNSKFVACPGGMNPETFRLYEALEAGAIPLYVRQEGDALYFKKLTETIPIHSIDSWDHAPLVVKYFLDNGDKMEAYRKALLVGWGQTKELMSKSVKQTLGF